MDARDMGQDLEKVLFTKEQIDEKLTELAAMNLEIPYKSDRPYLDLFP